jgi:hypothetical protein
MNPSRRAATSVVVPPLIVGVALLAACGPNAAERAEKQDQRQATRDQERADAQNVLAAFAAKHGADPLDLSDLSKMLTASAQEKLEGKVWAFRAAILDVSRTAPDAYALHLVDSPLSPLTRTWLTLQMTGLIAKPLLAIGDPGAESTFTRPGLLVAARISDMRPITVRIEPCMFGSVEQRDCEQVYLSTWMSLGRPRQIFGEVVALESQAK